MRSRASTASSSRPKFVPHASLLFSPDLEALETENQKSLILSNTRYASTLDDSVRDLAPVPAKKYILVTCMDSRIDPTTAFGVQPGDAHVIRNAGGSAKDALRSILISQHFMGTSEVIVIKHTGCEMMMFNNEEAHSMVEHQQGKGCIDADFDFHCFSNLEQSLRDDVAWLKGHKAIVQGTDVSGWVYEAESGRVRQVV